MTRYAANKSESYLPEEGHQEETDEKGRLALG
jgi:hypothetical protein